MSNEKTKRWLVRGTVLAAVVLLGAWIANNTYWDDIAVPMPMKGEAITNPQYAVRKLLEGLKVSVESHESIKSLPPANAVLVVNFWHWDLIDVRRKQMEAWVRAGGRLVVDPTLIGLFEGFTKFSGIEKRWPEPTEDEDKEDEDSEDEEQEKKSASKDNSEKKRPGRKPAPKPPRRMLAAADDADSCVSWTTTIDADHTPDERKGYLFCRFRTVGWLVSNSKPVWALRSEEGLQAVRVQVGKGFVTVINGTPFTNRTLRDVDRGALFVAATQLRHDDVVWLVTEADHPSLLALIWRDGSPVVVFFALFVAAVCWRNAIRFGPLNAPASLARRSLAEQIRGTGWFILRLGGAQSLYSAMLRAVREVAKRRIARFDQLTPEQQVAELAAHTGVDRESLQQAIYAATLEPGSFARRKSRSELYRAIATLEVVRRALVHDKSLLHSSHFAAHTNAHEASHDH